MRHKNSVALASLLLLTVSVPSRAADFTYPDGTVVRADELYLLVPENRNSPESRQVELHYLRFPAAGEPRGAPIVFLAGGPGGSGIEAARELYPLFDSLRAFGDVIALDQRGTGRSSDVPECKSGHGIAVGAPFHFPSLVDQFIQAATACSAFWRELGIDLAGYTALESAHDLDALRSALGVEKIALLGISYGSRLALTALRELPGKIDRAVLVSVEPLQAVIKKPASLDAHVARLQDVIDLDPDASQMYPDIAKLIRRVHAKLDAQPVQLEIPDGEKKLVQLDLDGAQMRLLASGGLVDPGNVAQLLSLYAALDAGRAPDPMFLNMLLGFRRRLDPLTTNVMAVMDYTAGISPERLESIREHGPASLFGDYQSYEPLVLAAMGLSDLGAGYREPVRTEVPTLVLTGTLDGRYDPDDEQQALQGLTELSRVMVVNGGHNLLDQGSAIGELIRTFMSGGALPPLITVPPPSFPQQRR